MPEIFCLSNISLSSCEYALALSSTAKRPTGIHKSILPMITDIKIGVSASTEIVVGTRDTAHHVGSGRIKVLATPVMVMLLEEAALKAVEDILPPGLQTVGTRLDVSHIAATPVGMRVVANAKVTGADGRKLTFKVWAEDEMEVIGEGTHERMMVDLERFDKRVARKTGNSV